MENLSLILSVIALIISGIALFISYRKLKISERDQELNKSAKQNENDRDEISKKKMVEIDIKQVNKLQTHQENSIITFYIEIINKSESSICLGSVDLFILNNGGNPNILLPTNNSTEFKDKVIEPKDRLSRDYYVKVDSGIKPNIIKYPLQVVVTDMEGDFFNSNPFLIQTSNNNS